MATQRKETNRGLDRTPDGVLRGITLSILCVISNRLITHMLPHTLSISRDDDLLGGMWAVVATVFVYRFSPEEQPEAVLAGFQAFFRS
jgi:hypothetical protein